jgi:hypothetical protein
MIVTVEHWVDDFHPIRLTFRPLPEGTSIWTRDEAGKSPNPIVGFSTVVEVVDVQ